ncbi:MAG TPA: lysophospholipid acyltransferase family protein [Anaeromyxobacter sp.]|nr:lysophospholipid acyltransferase family protein [Anaeromyxobacter sp.]
MLRAISALYWAYVLLTMPVLFLGAFLVFLLTVPFDRRRVALQLYSCAWATLYVVSNPLWRSRVKGRSRLPWRGPAVIVANHLSMLDILVLYGLFRPFKWVAKAELFRVPVVGWNMWINDYVPVLRGDRESVKRMMARCRAHLERGTPLLLFPEGTRALDGHLQRFKDGAFRLAFEARVPVVPVVLTGTYEALPKHGMAMRGPMRARVEVLEPLEPTAFESAEALRDAARRAMTAALPEAHRPLTEESAAAAVRG